MPEDTQDQPVAAEGAPEAQQADALPEVDVDVEDAGTLKKKVTVTVPRKRIDAKFDEMFGELSSTAQVPGFRIGHAPRRLIEKRFGKEVSQDVRNAVIGESLGSALKKSELKALGEPDVDLEKIELPEAGDMSFSFEVEVSPEFDLPELKGIEVTRQELQITDEGVDEYIQQVRHSRAKFEATDGPAAEGDVVTAGARITGEDVTPMDRPGLTLRVAPGQIEGLPLVDLGEALAGKKPGETASLKVKVPDAHPNEKWRGKELQVDVTVSQIRRAILPEASETFAEELGFASLEQLRQYLLERLKQRQADQTRQSMRDQIVRHLLDNTQFDLPEGVVKRHTGRLLARRYIDLLNMGVPREKIDENLTQLQADVSEQARASLKASFILAKIAEQESIQVNPDEVNARIAQMAGRYNRRPERLRQELQREGQLSEVEAAVREEKVLDMLLEQAVVKEVPVEDKQPADAGGEADDKAKAKPKAKAASKPGGRSKAKTAKPAADKPKARTKPPAGPKGKQGKAKT
ncbi:MAG TPA: trigger factor [Phycisphaerae bacterium]|nr:trigger factor [Phycisphaerae bacterium]